MRGAREELVQPCLKGTHRSIQPPRVPVQRAQVEVRKCRPSLAIISRAPSPEICEAADVLLAFEFKLAAAAVGLYLPGAGVEKVRDRRQPLDPAA